MKKMLFFPLILICTIAYAGQWRGGAGDNTLLGTTTVSDIDTEIYNEITNPIDRVLSEYREGLKLKYNSVSTLDVTSGQIVVSNAAGTIRLMVNTSSTTTLTWANIDTGAEASGTTYYVYAKVSSTSDTTATFVMSTNSSTPSGVTYYKKLGQFINDGSSNITAVQNDDDNVIVATGTISNGGTISLPSGWAQDECDWTVGLGEQTTRTGAGTIGGTTNRHTVNSSRVVTCYGSAIDINGNSTGQLSGDCNYIIACHR